MKTITGIILFSFFLGRAEASIINAASTSQTDVSSAINSAVNGDTVVIPAGTSTWATGVNVVGKAIKIQGAGSGRIIGRTLTSATVGTGSKTFTTQSGLAITNGQTLRVIRRTTQSDGTSDLSGTYLLGTVTSYSGTTLTLNVTSAGGSGTYAAWIIATEPLTVITGTMTSGQCFSVTPSTGNVDISGIKFIAPASSGTGDWVFLLNDAYPNETIIHDCWFRSGYNAQTIYAKTNSFLIYNCSFDSSFSAVEAIAVKWESGNGPNSWLTVDTLGNRDTTGNKNGYIEDCDFHFFLNTTNFDSNARAVFRHNLCDNAGLASHGGDTSPYGNRHWEVYNNTFVLEPTTNGVVLNVNYWFFIRGGTGVITDNVMPQIISQDWGHKNAVAMMVENIRRAGTPGLYPIGPYPCWTTYPVPHSPGQGNNGSIGTMLAGDFTDPIRIWNNTGPVDSSDVAVQQYQPDECGNGELASNFTQINRDYYFSTDATAARPGYVKFTYPHPLRAASSSSPPPPQNLHTM